MDIRSNEPFWLVKNAFTKSYPSLQKSICTDILIIGGGITGALITYELMDTGKDVVLIDKRDICHGSTSASTAMLQYEIDVPLHKLIELRGVGTAVSSYKSCEKAIFQLEKIVAEINSKCDFQRKKSIYFTSNKKHIAMLEEEFRTRQKFGFEVRWLGETELEQMGLNALAAIESNSGAIIDPYKLSNDLLAMSANNGLRIYDKTEIVDFKEDEDKLLAITPENLTVKANHIIHCTGYESISTISGKVVDLKSTYAMASEAFEKMPSAFKNHIYWETSSPYLYFRPTRDNRILVGGGDENFKNAKKRNALMDKKKKFLAKQFQKCFPDIQFKPDYMWAGTFGETKDGLPYMGRPDKSQNHHYVLGFGGNGITYSVMAMDAILDSLHHTNHIFLEDYCFNR